ncbi:choline transporter-like 2 isoform X3 [Pectinophora gossypiella]|uniref:choline transporter-like 2 isoform X3 n=1 Tax=Pectinophora gossypiella TaxID=13191 RepID=UPI00214EE025|nr:choline transporter-like 2 isoform X3 [Pectinophora gossypiella]
MGCCDCCIPPKESREPIRYDPHFDGPIRNRSCTDVIWLIIFILFLGVWGYVGYYSITTGNVEKLLAPIDSNGNRCGLDSKYENKKYLVFFNISSCLSPTTPITGCRTPQVCVESCPTRTILFQAELSVTPFEQLRPYMVCTDDINKETMTLSDAKNYINNGKCADHVLKSQPVLGRCLVNVTDVLNHIEDFATGLGLSIDEVQESLKRLIQFDQLSSQIVQDLVQSRWYMLGALVVVVIICFLYILLLRWVVAPVVWTSIVGLLALLGFSLYLIYKNYAYYRANPVQLHQTTNLKGYFESIFTKSSTWLVILIIVAILWVILLMIIIFLRSRITIAIALIREGSKAVSAIKSTVFFPIFPWLLQCAVIAYGVVVLMYIISIGDSAFRVVGLKNDTNCDCKGVYTEDYVPCDPLTFTASCFDTSNGIRQCQQAVCHFTGIDNPRSVAYLHLVNLLGFFWTMFFISGTADMMLASTFSTWYWTPKRDLPFFTLTAGIFRTLCYHLGTVAFGSLIIAIVRVIRVILEYIDHKLKKFDNPFTRCLMCCCKCFFWCLENFIKFINKNAYIMCAVHGKNFCTSARDAFSLLMRNIVRVVVLDKVMDFIFFLSKLLISIGVGFAVYYIAQWNYVYEVTNGERLNYSYIPAIILAIATYLISSIFFNVYSMAVDTLFLCFLEDCERNDGTPQKPYAMSTNLMKILGKRNKKAKPE